MQPKSKNSIGNFNIFKVGKDCHIGDVINHYHYNTSYKDMVFIIILAMTKKDYTSLFNEKIRDICPHKPDDIYYIVDDDDDDKELQGFFELSFEEGMNRLNDRYHETSYKWKPFGKKTIDEILDDFFTLRPIQNRSIITISFENNPIDALKESDLRDFITILSRAIIIIDSVSLIHTFYRHQVKHNCPRSAGIVTCNCDSQPKHLSQLSKLMIKRTMNFFDDKRQEDGSDTKVHFHMRDEKELKQRLLNTCNALELNLGFKAFENQKKIPNSLSLGQIQQ